MKRKTKKDEIEGYYRVFKQAKGESTGAKDGSIATHPVVAVDSTKTEAEVLADCKRWFDQRRIVCDRNNTGAGDFGGGYRRYGIKGGGDIIGMLRNGRHFEVETKCGKGGRFSKDQQTRMDRIRRSNGLYYVVHGVEELEHFLGGMA